MTRSEPRTDGWGGFRRNRTHIISLDYPHLRKHLLNREELEYSKYVYDVIFTLIYIYIYIYKGLAFALFSFT